MTNREWVLNKMQNMSDEEIAEILACETRICKIMDKECNGGDCSDCIFPWLKSEHKEKITLSEAERIILENIDKDYNWIARDSEGELYIFNAKPIKRDWDWNSISKSNEFYCYSHLFQFIKWEDEEPYNISELLKGE